MLPRLADFDTTRQSLHHASQIIAAVRAHVTPPLPNTLRLSVQVVPQGLTTGPLNIGGDLLLDFRAAAITYRQPGEPPLSVSLAGESQATAARALLALLAEEGHDLAPDTDKLSDDTPFNIDSQAAHDYAAALYSIFTAVARFRARLFGPQSPVVVWPHGFDLSTVWFAGDGADEHKDPHMNFGFSPASPGFDRPYLYSYAWPLPHGFMEVALPPLAHIVSEPFTGIVVHYDDLLTLAEPEAEIENLLLAIYRAVSPLMNGG